MRRTVLRRWTSRNSARPRPRPGRPTTNWPRPPPTAERPPGGDAQLGTAESAFDRALDDPGGPAGRLAAPGRCPDQRHGHGHRDRRPRVERLLAAGADRPHRHPDRRPPAGREGRPGGVGRGGPGTGIGRRGGSRARADPLRAGTGSEVVEARLATARADRDAAYARFEELAPGRLPSEVEEIIADPTTVARPRPPSPRPPRRAAADAGALAESLLQDGPRAGAAADRRTGRGGSPPGRTGGPGEAPEVEVEPEARPKVEPGQEISVASPKQSRPNRSRGCDDAGARRGAGHGQPVVVRFAGGTGRCRRPPRLPSGPWPSVCRPKGAKRWPGSKPSWPPSTESSWPRESLEWHEANGSAEPAAAEAAAGEALSGFDLLGHGLGAAAEAGHPLPLDGAVAAAPAGPAAPAEHVARPGRTRRRTGSWGGRGRRRCGLPGSSPPARPAAGHRQA